MNEKYSFKAVLPVLFAFFVMGLADLVGIATNYVKQDFQLSDTLANLLPFSLFLWFAVLSVPAGLFTTKIGRKNTVLLSIIISILGLFVSFFSQHFATMLIAFALLGIGNTIMQVSLNSLMTNIVSPGRLTSSLTLGQFIKAVSAFLGPIVAGFTSSFFGNWRFTFVVFGVVSVMAAIWLALTTIPREEKTNAGNITIGTTLGLLKNSTILMLFFAIVFVVGADVGLNTTLPKFIMERCSVSIEEAGLVNSLYFVARTLGTLLGSFLLIRFSPRIFFFWGMVLAIGALVFILLSYNIWAIYSLVALIGFALANVFSIVFSAALRKMPNSTNEISGLMIMGVAGGAVFPVIIGLVSDFTNLTVGMAVLSVAFVYLLVASFKMDKN